MPIDKPKPGETKDHYINYCMGVLKDEFPEIPQRYAVCVSKWEEKFSMLSNGLKDIQKKSIQKFATIGPRGGVRPSPKAPKSDTKNPDPKRGSDKNKPGAASTGRGVEVPQSVLDNLQKKADEWNEKYKEKKGYGANVGALKTDYQRGVGAFQTSHSPAVKSQQQWAYARVNAFLYLLKNGRPENPKYVGDYDLLPEKHPKSNK